MKKWMCAASLTLLFLLSGCGKEEIVETTEISTKDSPLSRRRFDQSFPKK